MCVKFVKLLKSGFSQVFLNQEKDKTLGEAGFKPGKEIRNSVVLLNIKHVTLECVTDENNGECTGGQESSAPPAPPLPIAAASTEASMTYNRWSAVSHDNEVPSKCSSSNLTTEFYID